MSMECFFGAKKSQFTLQLIAKLHILSLLTQIFLKKLMFLSNDYPNSNLVSNKTSAR
jgi:hypothetical protein